MYGIKGFDNHLRAIMLNKRITPYQLHVQTGVSKSYIYALCSGNCTNPTLEICRRIAFALDITLLELLDVKEWDLWKIIVIILKWIFLMMKLM